MSSRYQAAILSASFNGLKAPDAPTIGTATASAGAASVTFTAPANVGGGAITSYTVISSPGSVLGTGASSPITVSGLTNGTAYTFTVVATNAYGTGPASAASNSVTPAVNYIEAVFSTWLYTGNGTGQSIVNGINLSTNGGMVWCKARSNVESNFVGDTVRGANKALITNSTAAEDTNPRITAFNSNGFSLNSSGNSPNVDGYTYASWTFREQEKFFDVVTYTGDGVTGRTVAHNLGSTPGMIIVKGVDIARGWFCYHQSLGATKYIELSSTGAAATDSTFWSDTAPTSTNFTVGGASQVNLAGYTYVAYIFAHNAGGFGASGTDNVISCGSFTTDGSGNATVTLGYEPQWLLVKASSASGGWIMSDIMRAFPASAGSSNRLLANTSAAETTGSTVPGQPTATGFIAVGDPSTTYIYIAIRRGPMAIPTVGTSVFTPVTRTGTSAVGTSVSGFATDSYWIQRRNGTGYNQNFDRLRGALMSLQRYNNATQNDNADTALAFPNNGVSIGADSSAWAFNTSGETYIDYHFQRAPSFFDEVCYTGTGANRTVTHNLAAVPELMIIKSRSDAEFWAVYNTTTGNNASLSMNENPVDSPSGFWNTTTPTSSVFSLGVGNRINGSAKTYVAYLFATCAGVSKVGSYTGTATTKQIDCGFTGGARFVLIKRTDLAGNWYVWDTARGIVSGNDPYLLLDLTDAEVTNTDYIDTYSAGFEVTSTAPAALNATGGTYIFLAIA